MSNIKVEFRIRALQQGKQNQTVQGDFHLKQYKDQVILFCLGTYRGPEQSIKTMFNTQPTRLVQTTFLKFQMQFKSL